MTSQPQPAPGEGRPVGQFLRPLRDLAAWALVAATAVLLFVAVLRLIPAGDGEQFASRTQNSFYDFVNLATILFPLAAVLLALLVRPQHPKAKVITVIAAGEYAVAAFFSVIFGILVGVIQIAGFNVRTAFEEFLVRIAWLAVFALAAYATYLVWRNLFYVPKPQPQPGMYGQPQYGVPGAYPGQPGYGQPGGYPPPGQPGYGPQPGQPGPPGYGQPGQPGPGYGQPGQPPAHSGAHAWGQPPVSAQPASGQPAPSSGVPGPPPGPFAPGQAPGAPPAGQYGPFSEPTQAVPRHEPNPPHPDADRTAMLPDDRPGYGPADQDPPRR